MDLGIKEIEKELMKKESELDHMMVKSREIVRLCSNAIKAIHSKDLTEAKKLLKEAEKEVMAVKKFETDFPGHVNHIMQEYVEAKVTLSAVETKKIPAYKEFDCSVEPYLTGLLDATGELKREMYESLRHGRKDDAQKFFEMMESIYDELLPLRFSNAVLPEFRRKQDVARIQIEQARGELL